MLNTVLVSTVVLAVLIAGASAALVSLWRHRVRGRRHRAARAVGLLCLVFLTGYLMYLACTGVAFAYMTRTYENVQTGQMRADVQSMMHFFGESPDSLPPIATAPPATKSVFRYSLLGLDGWDIHVAYDVQDRALAVVDTYE